MSITCKIQVSLNDVPVQKAAAIRRALEPDNVDFPENLALSMENVDNKLVISFEGRRNMKALIATVDEVLEHVQLALKVMK